MTWKIIPILNKIDMDSAMIDEVSDQIIELIGCGKGWNPISQRENRPGRSGNSDRDRWSAFLPPKEILAPLQALIFDSVFNSSGVIAYFRIINGTLRKGDQVRFVNTGKHYQADEVSVLGSHPSRKNHWKPVMLLHHHRNQRVPWDQSWRYNNQGRKSL